MRKQMKKWLSLLLAFVLTFSGMSNVAMAENGGETRNTAESHSLRVGDVIVLPGVVEEGETLQTNGVVSVAGEVSGWTEYTETISETGKYFIRHNGGDVLTNIYTGVFKQDGQITGLRPEATIDFNNKSMADWVWTINVVDNGFTIQDVNGKYINFSGNSGNDIKVCLSDEARVFKYQDNKILSVDAFNNMSNIGLDKFGPDGVAAWNGTGNTWKFYQPTFTGNTVVTALTEGTTNITVGDVTYAITVGKEQRNVQLEVGEKLVLKGEMTEVPENESVVRVADYKEVTSYEQVSPDANGKVPDGKYLIGYTNGRIIVNSKMAADNYSRGLRMMSVDKANDYLTSCLWTMKSVENGEGYTTYTIQDAGGYYMNMEYNSGKSSESHVTVTDEVQVFTVKQKNGNACTIASTISTNSNSTKEYELNKAGSENADKVVGWYEVGSPWYLYQPEMSTIGVEITAVAAGIARMVVDDVIYNISIGTKAIELELGESFVVMGNVEDVEAATGVVAVKEAQKYKKIRFADCNEIPEGTYLVGVYNKNSNPKSYSIMTNKPYFSNRSRMELLVAADANNIFDENLNTASFVWNIQKEEGGYTFRDVTGGFLNIASGKVTVSNTKQILTIGQGNGALANQEKGFAIGGAGTYLNNNAGNGDGVTTYNNTDDWFFFIPDGSIEITATKVGETVIEVGGVPYQLNVTPCTHKTTTVEGQKAETCTAVGATGATVCANVYCKAEITPSSEIPAKGHNYAADWSTDETNHWHACANGCGLKEDVAPHTYGEVKFDETNHWVECEVCEATKDVTAHVWQQVADKESGKTDYECSSEGCNATKQEVIITEEQKLAYEIEDKSGTTESWNVGNILDGNFADGSRWESNNLQDGNSSSEYVRPAYVVLDLGEKAGLISKLNIDYAMKMWPTAYEIQISNDNAAWTTVYKIENKNSSDNTNMVDTIEFDTPINARYIRMYVTRINSNAASRRVGISEFEVFGRTINRTATVAEVATLEDIVHVSGSEFDATQFNPVQTVQLSVENVSEKQTVQVITTWDLENLKLDVAGKYALNGTLQLNGIANTNDLTVKRNVIVKEELNVVLGSVVNGTKTEAIANLTGGGTKYTGDSVAVTAPAKVGYEFIGWYTKEVAGTDYTGKTALSTDYTYTFTATANAELVAVYVPDGKVSLTITDTTKVTVTGAENYEAGVKAGTEVTVTYADAANFLYWKNASGKVVSTDAAYKFTVVNNTTLTPVAKSATIGSALVEFVNEYDQVLSVSTWAADGKDALSTVMPSKLGYDCTGWAFENAPKTAVDAAAVRTAITGGATYVRLVPVYAKANKTSAVTYNDGTDEQTVQVALGETYTVTAGTVDGQNFSHWAIGNEIVSYNTSYTFLVTGDVTLTAVFVAENETVEKASILEITSQYEIKNGETVEKVAFVASREIAEGYTVLEHGMLYARNSEITDAAAFVEGVAGVNKFTASGTGMKGALTLNVKLNGATSIKVRAYAIVKNNTTGEVTTLYSDMATYTAQQ